MFGNFIRHLHLFFPGCYIKFLVLLLIYVRTRYSPRRLKIIPHANREELIYFVAEDIFAVKMVFIHCSALNCF
jgi:hypothetical protein